MLREFTMAQLQELAKENGIELVDGGMFGTGKPLKSKDAVVAKIAEAARSVSSEAIERFAKKKGIVIAPAQPPPLFPPPRNLTPPVSSPQTQPTHTLHQIPRAPEPVISSSSRMTPSIPIAADSGPASPSRPPTLVPFDEVLTYVTSYNFMANYDLESLYQAELAGALRERYGTSLVRKEFPVPIPGKRRIIDIDIGGVGVEIKSHLRTGVSLRNAKAQLEEYMQHYGSNLIFLLIGTQGLAADKHDIRALPITFIDR